MHPHIWYPFTQAKTSPEPLKVRSAQGIWLELESGQWILDCISSWWVNLHGHSHPHIAQAIYHQAQQLEHVIFAGVTHEPAERLATQLVQKLPAGLTRVFFSDNGSTAVEVALKMAYQYWCNRDQPRTSFLAFEGAYHGDTLGAMSVGGRSVFSVVFSDLLFKVDSMPFPATYLEDSGRADRERDSLSAIEQTLTRYPTRYAGLIIEPLIQGAGGMRLCTPEFLQRLYEITQRFQVLLIYDEVMTGFGRTGDWFACVKASVKPDIICLAKGLTGGFLPLAVTVCTEAIYDAFYSDDPLKTLYHGHSYTANPLGCAAGLASLELLDQQTSFQVMEEWHRRGLQRLQGHPRLKQLRVMGTLAAMDVITTEAPGYLNKIALEIRQRALEQGLLLRPLGNTLYILPPYCITEAELQGIYDVILNILPT